ncbi:hypothetical protein, partial [Sinorhizobium meliloti]
PASAEETHHLFLSLHKAIRNLIADGQTELSLFHDAVPIDTWLILTDLQSSAKIVEEISTASQEPNWVGKTKAHGLLDAYRDFVDTSSWGRLPFNSSEAEEFQGVIARLFTRDGQKLRPRPGYKTYLTLRADYVSALDRWQSTPPAQRTPELTDRLNQTREALNQITRGEDGARTKLADAKLRNLYGYDYTYFKRRAENRLSSYSANATSSLLPSLNSILLEPRWMEAELQAVPDGAAPFGYVPLLSQDWCCTEGGVHFTANVSQLSFEIAIADIIRPWLDADAVFGAGRNFWRYKTGNGPKLSIGRPSTDEMWEGAITFLPLRTILVRNLRIGVDGDPTVFKAIQSALSRRSQLRYGPFAIAGEFDGPIGRVPVAPYLDPSGTLVVPQAQLLGSVGEITPMSPEPREGLVWEDPLPILPIE